MNVLIIPALDEEAIIGSVVASFVRRVDRVIVVDNGSRDATAARAREAGALVVHEPRRGYGSACLAGIKAAGACEVIAFADGDGACDPDDLPALLAALKGADLVIGSRTKKAERGALTPPQLFGNMLVVALFRGIYGVRATDLGPYRAIRREALDRLGMEDTTYGWTIEMQIKAAKKGLRVVEVDVGHRVRQAGKSKISGTVRGVFGAGRVIIGTLIRYI